MVTKVPEPEKKLVQEVQTIYWLLAVNAATSSSETQGFNGDGKGRERLEAGKKEGGGEGKGKGKGEALGSFSIQIISRSITFLSCYWPHF